MEHVLITGGAGFVGSNLAARLHARGMQVTVLDDFSNGRRENLLEGVSLVDANLAGSEWMSLLAGKGITAVVHCAAQASNARSFADPVVDLDSNQVSTLNVVQFCRTEGIRRLLFTSTMSAYGDAGLFPTPPSHRLKPQSFYAVHKVAAEHYVNLCDDLDWTIVRLYTTYGAGQNLENREQGLVKIFLSYILNGEEIEVHGSGQRVRDIVHVDDVTRAMEMCLGAPSTYKKTYNLGSGQTITIDEIIARLALKFTGSSDYPVTYTDGDIGDPACTHADISDCEADFGWRPEVAPIDGIDRTVQPYLEGNAD